MNHDFRDELLGANRRKFQPSAFSTDDEEEQSIYPAPETSNQKPEKPASFWKKAFSFLTLCLLLIGFWVAGQVSLGIPDELVAQILTILIYNWFVNNGYKLPSWLKK